jgi:hypothetical protein
MKTLFLFILLLCGHAFADDAAVKKFRNFTPEQVKNLSQKVRDSELPMMYTLAAQKGLSKGVQVLYGMELNSLMYPGIGNYESAVKAFQKDLGDPATGVLTVWQIHNLEKRAEKKKLARVSFPNQFSSYKNENYTSVEGTLILLDEAIAWPINHVKLKCYKKESYCEFDQIILATPDDSAWSQSFQVMWHETEIFQITRWSGDIIDAAKNTDNECRILSLNLNFKNKEFFYNTRNGVSNCNIMGKDLPKLPKPRIAQIVDGKTIYDREFAKIEKSAYEGLSTEFRKNIEQMIAKEEKK